MAYWRMQLHPSDGRGTRHAAESLAAGFIGLDFGQNRGDMTHIGNVSALPQGEQDYLDFANKMAIGDHVLVIANNYPLALVKVRGEYNYIRHTVPELGVWFRHFRQVCDIRYYGDWVTNPKA